jgi:hypothetical protein
MKSFYEIHDSTLNEVIDAKDRLTLRLNAIRIDWPTAEMDVDDDVFTQEIQLEFEGVKISKDGERNPVNLLDGSFTADHHDGDFIDEDCYVIPTSLRRAEGVRIVLAGTDEANEAYITMELQAASMRLTPLSPPKFLEKFPRQAL